MGNYLLDILTSQNVRKGVYWKPYLMINNSDDIKSLSVNNDFLECPPLEKGDLGGFANG